ncbi:hypothetical protein [Paenibacillus sp. FSL K6-2524]|uniref:hypothetical protein n=1 Tax=Paenibacillus sp. FSL K6-2524 TaxID=2954516 RepID=UPI0030F7D048
MMNLSFRLVIFEGVLEIDRVPIYECELDCYHEVFPAIKADLKALLSSLKQQGKNGRIIFTEVNELAHLIFDIYRTWEQSESLPFEALLERKSGERINLLLDLYGCAKAMNDSGWMGDISNRLAQMSNIVKDRQFSEENQRFTY